jgi:hypothetical protein
MMNEHMARARRAEMIGEAERARLARQAGGRSGAPGRTGTGLGSRLMSAAAMRWRGLRGAGGGARADRGVSLWSPTHRGKAIGRTP